MIKTEFKKINVIPDGDEVCLRIEDEDSLTGILNLCWLTEYETERLIECLQKAKDELVDKRMKITKIINNTNFTKLYQELEDRYNPYPVQMSHQEAFGRAYSEGLIDKDLYQAARRYYGKLWCYVGD